MNKEWVLDVLADLKAFAEANDLCAISAKLDEVSDTARAELLESELTPPRRPTHRDVADPRKFH